MNGSWSEIWACSAKGGDGREEEHGGSQNPHGGSTSRGTGMTRGGWESSEPPKRIDIDLLEID